MSRASIHQLVIGAAPGDAVTAMAMRVRTALRERGTSELFGLHIDPALHENVRDWNELQLGTTDGVVVYHATYGDPRITEMLMATQLRIVLCYHNITPAAFFDDDYTEFADGLRWGRRELEIIRPQVVAAVADSSFNANELVALGYQEVHVLPAGLEPLRLLRFLPSPTVDRDISKATAGWEYVVAVAQQLPHKRLDVLIQAVHLLQTVHRRHVGLVIVGADRLPMYGGALRTLAAQLRVRGIWFAGSVDDNGLVSILRRARVFASASMHEGLGLPPIEAMGFDVPVVVRAIAAVPETVGDAALLLPPDAGPELFAEGIGRLLDDENARAELIARGRRRVQELAQDNPTSRLVELLVGLAT